MRLRFDSGERLGTTVEVTSEAFTVGRGDDCDLVVADDEASRHHARFRRTSSGAVVVEDLGSTNGTRVDGVRIDGPHALEDGASVRVGETVLVVELPAAAAGDRTVVGERPKARAPAAPRPAGPPPAPPPAVSTTVPPRRRETSASRIQSRIERARLRKSANRALILATASLAAVVVIVALALTGVLGGDDGGGGEGAPAVEDVVARVSPSTVLVITARAGRRLGSGTGWVLDADDGLIVTNNHVINGGESFRVGAGDRMRPARVLAAAPCEDTALLQVSDRDGLKQLPLGSQEGLREGQSVVAVGFPTNASLEDNLTSTAGVVSVVRTSIRVRSPDIPRLPNVVQTDAAINPGNSGGPLVSLRSELVGMNTLSYQQSGGQALQTQNYAVGVDRLQRIVRRLRSGRSIGWTGLGLEFPDARTLRRQGLPAGLLAVSAVPGTPAARAGFGRRAMLITAIDNRRVDGRLQSYCDAVRGIASGRTAVFDVIGRIGAARQRVRVGFR